MDDLHGAKVHEPAGYELSGSGRPPATLHDFDAQKTVPDLTVRGPCRNPGLIEEISGCYDVGALRVIPLAALVSSWLLPQRANTAIVSLSKHPATSRPMRPRSFQPHAAKSSDHLQRARRPIKRVGVVRHFD